MAWGRYIFSLSLILTLQAAGGSAWAEDMDSVDAEVEESMLDSDATSAQAKLMRQRQMRLQMENERDQKQAEELRKKASAKQREARLNLQNTEVAVKRLLEEQTRLHKEIRESNAKLQKSDADIKAARTKLAKLKLDTETLQTLKFAQRKRLEKNHEYLARLQREQLQAQSDQTKTKADWERLKTMTEESDRKIASAEKAQGVRRPPDWQDSPEAKAAPRQPASSRRMLSNDCRVYEAPNANAKVLGIKRAGSTVSTGPATADWVAVTLLKRTLYVRSDCF